jgi:chromosome segregation ATPase
MVDEALNLQNIDQKLNALNQQMAKNVATLEKLVTASMWTAESIKNQETRLHAVENTLEDVRHRQLSKFRGDIATVQDGASHLEARCTDALDDVNL